MGNFVGILINADNSNVQMVATKMLCNTFKLLQDLLEKKLGLYSC